MGMGHPSMPKRTILKDFVRLFCCASVEVTEASYRRWQKREADATAACLKNREMQAASFTDAVMARSST
jgi:hypothetical protein